MLRKIFLFCILSGLQSYSAQNMKFIPEGVIPGLGELPFSLSLVINADCIAKGDQKS